MGGVKIFRIQTTCFYQKKKLMITKTTFFSVSNLRQELTSTFFVMETLEIDKTDKTTMSKNN
jgi:hypothetical protein